MKEQSQTAMQKITIENALVEGRGLSSTASIQVLLNLTVTCVVYLKAKTFRSVRTLSKYGPVINKVAA